MVMPRDVVRPCGGAYISFLHCNTQSARHKHDELMMFLAEFGLKFDVIMFTETWYESEGEVLYLPGFRTFFLNRSHRRGGGVLQLVSEHMPCSLLTEFSIETPDYEALSLLYQKSVFVVLYRPPNGKLDAFLSFLESVLSFVSLNRLHITIGGDCNINLLQDTYQSRELQVILDSFGCKNVINEPTRISHSSESLMDLFVTNSIEDTIQSGVVSAAVSDHLPMYMFCKHGEIMKKSVNHS